MIKKIKEIQVSGLNISESNPDKQKTMKSGKKLRRMAIPLIVTVTLVSTFAFAAEGLLSYNIESAKKTAMENSKQGAIDDYNIKAKESALKDANDNAKKSFYGGTYSDIYNHNIKKFVKPMQAEAAIEIAKMQKLQKENDLKANVYQTTQKILLLKKQVETEQSKVAVLEEKYELQKTREKEGIIPATDLYDAEYALDSKEIEISRLQKTLAAETLKFKSLLNLPLDESPVDIEGTLKEETVKLLDIDEQVNNKITSDIDIYTNEQDYLAKKMTFEYAAELFHDYDTRYIETHCDMLSAEYALADAKSKVEVTTRNKYNDIYTDMDSLELAKRYEQLINQQLESLQQKYDNGLTSKDALLDMKMKWLDAQFATLNAIYNLNVTKMQ